MPVGYFDVKSLQRIKTMDFITISYNQERYIIEHLESIKFQITHYANRCEVNYRLFDDCSTDLTVTLARQWLEENSQLFSSIDIVENSTNLGLNQNYLQAGDCGRFPVHPTPRSRAACGSRPASSSPAPPTPAPTGTAGATR